VNESDRLSAGIESRALASELRAASRARCASTTAAARLYATDASNYRQVPIGVVIPTTVEDVIAAVEVCRAHACRSCRAAAAPACAASAATSRWCSTSPST
jgi:FAD/FMN-containing dehydrogenase